MDPDIFGPAGWFYLHSVTMQYPVSNPSPQDADTYRQFFLRAADTLPCEKCSISFHKHMQEDPINLDTRRALVKWLFRNHNAVNASNKMPKYEYAAFLRDFRARQANAVGIKNRRSPPKKIRGLISLGFAVFIGITIHRLRGLQSS